MSSTTDDSDAPRTQDGNRREVVADPGTRIGWRFMSEIACPMCETHEILAHAERFECSTCGHEWERPPEPEKARVVKDAHGTVLADGDQVILLKALPLKGSNQVLKGGSKSKAIKLVDGDHEISCKIDGIAVGLKACFVRKA